MVAPATMEGRGAKMDVLSRYGRVWGRLQYRGAAVGMQGRRIAGSLIQPANTLEKRYSIGRLIRPGGGGALYCLLAP